MSQRPDCQLLDTCTKSKTTSDKIWIDSRYHQRWSYAFFDTECESKPTLFFECWCRTNRSSLSSYHISCRRLFRSTMTRYHLINYMCRGLKIIVHEILDALRTCLGQRLRRVFVSDLQNWRSDSFNIDSRHHHYFQSDVFDWNLDTLQSMLVLEDKINSKSTSWNHFRSVIRQISIFPYQRIMELTLTNIVLISLHKS